MLTGYIFLVNLSRLDEFTALLVCCIGRQQNPKLSNVTQREQSLLKWHVLTVYVTTRTCARTGEGYLR